VGNLALALREVRYTNLSFWRNPAAAFFTFVFPLLFMVIFNVLFGGQASPEGFTAADFFTPGIIVYSIVTATYTNIAMSAVFTREEGILKRIRGTPLPSWAYLFGRIVHAVLVGALLVVIVAAFGAIFYQVDVPWARLPALIVTLVLGAATLCALGLAVSSLVPNEDAAPAVVNASIFPLLFISNVFIRLQNPPAWLDIAGNIFPIRHFADAMLGIYDPFTTGNGFAWDHLGVMALWAVAGVALTIRFFSWEPRGR
jgi:ABC-2 type transport system permease protein